MPFLPLTYAFLNLLILGALLFFTLRKTVGTFLVNRRKEFIKKSNESECCYRESVEKLRIVRAKSLSVAEDGSAFLDQTKRNSDMAGEKLIVDSRRKAAMILKDVEHLAGAELKQARNEIRARLVSKVMVETRIKLGARVNESRMSEYIDEYSTMAKKGAVTR